MKAVTYQGKYAVMVKKVAFPTIQDPEDVIIRITSTAICGSDLHLYQGNFPLPIGYQIGHEPMGIVEEIGPKVTKVKVGDRVVVPFTMACGKCPYCQNHHESQCDEANPHYDSGGYLGYSEKFGNYPGGQAEYLRIPFGIILHLSYQRTVRWRMNLCYCYQMFYQPPIGASKMQR